MMAEYEGDNNHDHFQRSAEFAEEARAQMALPAMRGSFALPIAYGYATVGVVEALGPGVEGARLGDIGAMGADELRGFDLVQVRLTTGSGDLIRVRDTVPVIRSLRDSAERMRRHEMEHAMKLLAKGEAPEKVLHTWYRMVLELVRHTPTFSPPVASRASWSMRPRCWEARRKSSVRPRRWRWSGAGCSSAASPASHGAARATTGSCCRWPAAGRRRSQGRCSRSKPATAGPTSCAASGRAASSKPAGA